MRADGHNHFTKLLIVTHAQLNMAHTKKSSVHYIMLHATDSHATALAQLDAHLSNRHIDLDPAGYFLIYLEETMLYAKHFGMVVNDEGLAINPETGKPLPAKGKIETPLLGIYSGRSAKEVCIKLFEETKLALQPSHAAYLGRELVRAEAALLSGTDYIQD